MLDDGRDRGALPLGLGDADAPPGLADPTQVEEAVLLPATDAAAYAERWRVLQRDAAEHPRQTLEEADALVLEVLSDVLEGFAARRAEVEGRWARDDVEDDGIRSVLRPHRALFLRLIDA